MKSTTGIKERNEWGEEMTGLTNERNAREGR
jgi:hypothetical protein